MRHKKKRTLQLHTGVQKKSNVIRNLLTSLVLHGKMITTKARARALKAEADSLFARLVAFSTKYDEAWAKRESDRLVKNILYTKQAWCKAVQDILPKYIQESRSSGFVISAKLGPRKGDAAEQYLVKLI